VDYEPGTSEALCSNDPDRRRRDGAGASAWKKGPKVWRDLMHGLSKRPVLTRAIGVAQIAGGIWWAIKQEDVD
jgi:hypothetical protein